MNSSLDIEYKVCKFNNQNIFFVLDNKNNPWFKSNDIAEILEYTNTRQAIRLNCDDDDKEIFSNLKRLLNSAFINLHPETIFINESGLYSLILSSKKEESKQFKKWVTKEVLPSIRKYGEYKLQKEIKELSDSFSNQLQIKDKELEESNNKINHLSKVVKNISFLKKEDIIYVVTTKHYMKSNIYKIGGTKENLMKQRLCQYNVGKHKDDNYFYVYYAKVNDYSLIEKIFKSLFKCHRIEDNKEMYNLFYDDIIYWLEIIINDNNRYIDILNK